MVFPAGHWEDADKTAGAYDLGLLEQAMQSAREFGAVAAVVIHRGRIVAADGTLSEKTVVRSIRKSLLSALIGIEVNRGTIELGATMKDLDIDDIEGLTAMEKQASVLDLLKARSGIYHPALAESKPMKNSKPQRGSHAPGTFWYYNNWDFNALGTIYERATGVSIFEGFQRDIAHPIGMQDYCAQDGEYMRGKSSIHPAYHIRLTLRDLARFGHLYLNAGRWLGRQIIAADWISQSLAAHSTTNGNGGYGYMWWTTGLDGEARNKASALGEQLPSVRYSAHGHFGQYLGIFPAKDLVLANFAVSEEKPAEKWKKFQDFVLCATKAVRPD